jgi:hypothetical protein
MPARAGTSGSRPGLANYIKQFARVVKQPRHGGCAIDSLVAQFRQSLGQAHAGGALPIYLERQALRRAGHTRHLTAREAFLPRRVSLRAPGSTDSARRPSASGRPSAGPDERHPRTRPDPTRLRALLPGSGMRCSRAMASQPQKVAKGRSASEACAGRVILVLAGARRRIRVNSSLPARDH